MHYGLRTAAIDYEYFSGQRLCLADNTHSAGHGTYERQGYIYSTLAGVVHVIEDDKVMFQTNK